MKTTTQQHIHTLLTRYPALAVCEQSLMQAMELLIPCFRGGHKLLVCGNGGSAADALHIVGELMKGFILPRSLPEEDCQKLTQCSENPAYLIENLQQALPAISLVSEIALSTAFANDKAADLSFAQQVYGYGQSGDVLLGISTSGNSKNVIYACETAKARGMKTISLTGRSGGKLARIFDCVIAVPAEQTNQIQELHLPVYHTICLALEEEFFGGETNT